MDHLQTLPEATRNGLDNETWKMEEGVGSRVKAVSTIEVTRTYLELRSASELQAARSDDSRLRIERVTNCEPSLYRHLYVEV